MCGLEEFIFEVPQFFTSLVCQSKIGKILCVNVEEFSKWKLLKDQLSTSFVIELA